jgi:hypothetical protein
MGRKATCVTMIRGQHHHVPMWLPSPAPVCMSLFLPVLCLLFSGVTLTWTVIRLLLLPYSHLFLSFRFSLRHYYAWKRIGCSIHTLDVAYRQHELEMKQPLSLHFHFFLFPSCLTCSFLPVRLFILLLTRLRFTQLILRRRSYSPSCLRDDAPNAAASCKKDSSA